MKREIMYLSPHCHHQNDSCIKMGSDESHFNISLIVKDKVTRQCPQTTTFEERGEPKRNRTEALLFTRLANAFPLGRTDSNRNPCLSRKSFYIIIYINIAALLGGEAWSSR